jgi:3'(2'), 5'-bisphosphate nucleotidase
MADVGRQALIALAHHSGDCGSADGGNVPEERHPVEVDLEECVARAREAALIAWQVIEPYYRGSFEVFEKRGEGPATEADIAADHAIIAHLSAHFPSDEFAFLTEETEKGHERLTRNYCWIVDPIDGTREFIDGRDDFAVQIGLAGRTNGDGPLEALVGVVYMPRTGVLYSATKGGGAWAENPADLNTRRRLRVQDVNRLEDARLVVTRQHMGKTLRSAIARLQVREVYHLGSLGVKVVELVEGRAALYLNTGYKGCKEWDVCAPAILLQEAGGEVTDLSGKPITYNKKDYYVHNGLLASNGRLHQHALRLLDLAERSE